ncbi:MAG: PAS domain S-box protein, partial [Ideonella sp.]
MDIEHRIVRPDGEIRHVRERAELVHDENHHPVVLSGTVMDITERVQAMETRRKAEELSSAIVASSLDAVITIDHDNRILEFNPSAETIFGWPRADVLGRDFSDMIIPERLREAHRRGMTRYLATGEKTHLNRRLEMPALRADGTEIVIELNATRLGLDTPPRFTAFLRDITQSKQADDNLRASEARFRTLFEQAAVGMCLVSAQGTFLRTNTRFSEIVGYSADALMTRNCIETTHPDDRAREALITAQMLAGELQASSWEKRYLHRDGREVWCNLTLTLMPAQAGEAPQFVGVIEDITERKKAETATADIVRIQQELASSELPLQAVMELIAERASGLTGAVGAVVELVDGADMVYTAGSGALADKVGMRLKRDGSLSGLSVQMNAVLRADDTETDPRCDRDVCRNIGARSVVVAPLRREGFEFQGVLKVMSNRPNAFTDRDVNNLQILAETLRAAIQRQLTAQKLLQTVERFDLATHAGGLGVWELDVHTNRLTWDERMYQLYGLRKEEFADAYDAWSRTLHPDDLERMDAEVQAALRGDRDFKTEFRVLWPDGSIHHIQAVADVVRDADGKALRMTGFNADITERKVAELSLKRANRALQLLSQCSEALVRAQSEAELLADFCGHCREIGGYRMAWVGYAQQDAARTIHYVAQSGDEGGYLDKVELSWDETVATGQGPAGHVIRSGQPVISADFEIDDQFIPWRDAARQYGLRSVVCLPLRSGDSTFGLLGLYSKEVNHPGAEELKLLQEMADDLAFGIGNLRARAQSQRMEAAILKIATSVSVGITDDFFVDLAVNLAEALDAQGAVVARLLPGEPAMAQTVAAVLDGQEIESFAYPVHGSPSDLVDNDALIVSDEVAGTFPESPLLAAFGALACVGRRLENADGQTVGWIYVLFREPLRDSGFVTSTLKIFATRATGEFDRLVADTRIREQAALLDKATDAIVVKDLTNRVVFWNRGAEKIYGWSAAEALGQRTSE